MRDAADVRSIETIRRFKAALIEFSDDGKLALAEAISDVNRTKFWLEGERLSFWQGEIRRRNAKVQQAKSDLYRAELQSRDQRPSCVVERKALQRAQAAMVEAEQKLAATRRWIQNLERESLLFKAALSQISTAVEIEVPSAVASMDRMLDAIEAYARLQIAPSESARNGPDLAALLPEAISATAETPEAHSAGTADTAAAEGGS